MVQAAVKDGVDGKDGLNGIDGKDGVDGKDGLNGIDGKDGREVEFSVSNQILRWRYVGDTEWNDLYELPENENDSANVSLNIAEMSNGIVTADKESYKVGDIITLTITPIDSSYSQKLYINGNALKLNWKSNTYSFIATEEVYNITGSFEKSLYMVANDVSRFDFSNQAHGILNIYYPLTNESWWADIKGNYKSITVKAKNYLPMSKSTGDSGFSVVLSVKLDNDKLYAFRIINDKAVRYGYNRFGSSGSVTGWGGWSWIDFAAASINGDGADFKLERTDANIITLSVNNTVVDTYTMEGVTSDNKVVSVGVRHYGNQGQKIELPFWLTT